MKNNVPCWDLSDLYSSIKDPQIKSDLKGTVKAAQKFQIKYKGKISQVDSAKKLLAITKEYEQIIQQSEKPLVYAELSFSVKSNDENVGALVQKTRTEYMKVKKELTFFELEFLWIPSKVLSKLCKSPSLKSYRHFYEKLLKEKPHRLSEAEEKILNDTLLTGELAFTRLFDNILGSKKYKLGRKTLNESETIALLYSSSSRKVREKAASAFTKGLKESLPNLSYIFNVLSHDKQIRDGYKKFSSPETPRHLENEITQEIVDVLSKTVVKNYHLVKDFYRFKKKALGLKKLYDYDRYAPVAKSKMKIPFDEAKKIILRAFDSFSAEYAACAKEFFDNNWIDAKLAKGKRGGAYCSYVAPDLHPYIFLNYSGSTKDVLTLAHELGHGVQAMLSRRQTRLNFDWPLTIAETASTFSELIVFDFLKREIKDQKELFSLYTEKIESIFATVFRQISMYNFEKDFHRLSREKGELTVKEINSLWIKRQKEMFGGSVELTSEYSVWWSYIPHFIHTPFYVYAYAFGELLTLSLYARYKKNNATFLKKYLEMLSLGGSKSPQKLMNPLEVDLNDPDFWQEGINIISDMVEEAKKMC